VTDNLMKEFVTTADYGSRKFEIKYGGEGIGFYLFVFEGGKNTYDYLQDSVEQTKKFAFEKFGVPLEAWQP
jgi:hypothetical protein